VAKVTSKLQVTVPKALATAYQIRPGDDLLWVAAGDAIRVMPARSLPKAGDSVAARLRLFDLATERQQARKRGGRRKPTKDRGWRREDLYDRDRTR
jgi:bifunctional DNA-binding transcriptional regulator/antitoxin component of YhaV-PrlF toxin-antitoxin module